MLDDQRPGCRFTSSAIVPNLSHHVLNTAQEQYLDDYRPGLTFGSGSHHMTANDIRVFAAEFDPQPFHVDEQEGLASIFKGLAASGWHTASVTARLLIESEFRPAGGIVGLGVDELRWLAPVHPGDVLHVQTEVLETRPSASRPTHGVLSARISTHNQAGALVQSYVLRLLVLQRPVGQGV